MNMSRRTRPQSDSNGPRYRGIPILWRAGPRVDVEAKLALVELPIFLLCRVEKAVAQAFGSGWVSTISR